jgi:hypothetical protein
MGHPLLTHHPHPGAVPPRANPNQPKKMQTAKKEIEFQIWQLEIAVIADWSSATPEGLARLQKMRARLAKYKAMLPFAK